MMMCTIGYGAGSVYFITGGVTPLTSTEVLDLDDPTSSCSRTTGSLPAPRYGRYYHSMNAGKGGRIIICGGGFGVEYSCITTLSPMGPWTSHSKLTDGRTHHASVTSGGKLHLIASSWAKRTVETLDLNGNVWRKRGPLPYSVGSRPCAVKINDSAIFLTGGDDAKSKSAIWEHEQDQWTPMADMDIERAGHSCGLITRQGRNYVLVAGGHNGSENAMRTSSLYDMSTNTWTPTGDMNQPRLGGQMLDGQFMAGGSATNGNYNLLDTIEQFDFDTRQWSNTQVKMKRARSYFAAVAVDRDTFC